ncbi:MAG: YhbY family RNA-binding protein [Desulfobacterales bacterium]
MSDSLIKAIDEALDTHELIKLKFNEFKEKAEKTAMVEIMEAETGAQLVGMIGHMAIFSGSRKIRKKEKSFFPEDNMAGDVFLDK